MPARIRPRRWTNVRRCWGAAFLALAWSSLAQPPDYDALSDRYGNIITEQHHAAAIALVQNPEQLEAVYADAARGMARAKNVWLELELNMARAGAGVADKSTRPGCLLIGYRELSGTCIPNWSFLDFLANDKPGAARLREVTSSAFAARARERGLENQAILSAINGLVGVGVAAAVLRQAEAAAGATKVVTNVANDARALDPNRLHHIFGKAEHALDDFVRQSGGREQAFRRIQEAANRAFREGRLRVGPNGELPTGNGGNVIDVEGTQVRLIGGRVVDGVVRIATASRKGLP